jgi:lipooligosaccharide transport system ATP-binding protein
MAGGTDALVRARALVKRFDDFTAVAGVDFDVRHGEAFGILGPNGAGKTSVMRMIAATSPVSAGSLSVFGLDPATDGPAIRSRLGVVSQDDNLDTDLSVSDNLLIYGRYFGLPRATIRGRIDELLEFAQLSDRRDDRVDPLSGGMKRRLVIARALLNTPDLLLLDEPTTGLDPQARHMLWERLWSLKRDGVTLLLTTHYMDEAEQLCDRLVVMDGGRIVDEGGPRELIERHCRREVVEARYATTDQQAAVVDRLGASGVQHESLGDRVLLYTDDADGAGALLSMNGIVPQSTIVRRSTLEDVFLILTGRTLEEV